MAEFDWDQGNRIKCQKHGVTPEEIEQAFEKPIYILPSKASQQTEGRLKAIAKTRTGRHVFIVFTVREKHGERHIRPISARYMHQKEVERYEKEAPPAPSL